MKKYHDRLYPLLSTVAVLVAVSPVFGAPSTKLMQGLNTAVSGTGVVQGTLTDVIAQWVQAILGIVGVVFFVLILYGGIRWMVSAGNEKNIDLAKKIITTATIGLAIVLAGYTITYWITAAISTAT